MRTTIALALLFLVATPVFAQDWVAGVETTSGATYSFLTHYSRRGDYVLWQTLSLLTYRSREGSVETRVNSPGVSSGIMRRWDSAETSFGVGTGYEVRWTDRRTTGRAPSRETEQGVLLEGDVVRRLGSRTAGRVAGRYSFANEWRAASADVGYTISGGVRIGPQIIWQGNEELSVTSAGAFVEIPLGRSIMRSALQLRGGQARIEHSDGTTETKPYFSAGIVLPFR